MIPGCDCDFESQSVASALRGIMHNDDHMLVIRNYSLEPVCSCINYNPGSWLVRLTSTLRTIYILRIVYEAYQSRSDPKRHLHTAFASPMSAVAGFGALSVQVCGL